MKPNVHLRNVALVALVMGSVLGAVGLSQIRAAVTESSIRVILTDQAAKPVATFSQAIEANGFIFVAGITPRDPKTGSVIEGDVAQQTERVLENIKGIVESAGSSLSRAVKTTVYLQDMGDFDAMDKVYARYFPSNPPARATVAVSRLHAGRVEIEMIALK
ncbi:MAG: Rid family detoxifying hydrolase [Rhodomicrobium sp.]